MGPTRLQLEPLSCFSVADWLPCLWKKPALWGSPCPVLRGQMVPVPIWELPSPQLHSDVCFLGLYYTALLFSFSWIMFIPRLSSCINPNQPVAPTLEMKNLTSFLLVMSNFWTRHIEQGWLFIQYVNIEFFQLSFNSWARFVMLSSLCYHFFDIIWVWSLLEREN